MLKCVELTTYKLDISYNIDFRQIYPAFHIGLLWDFVDRSLQQQPPLIEVEGEAAFQIEPFLGNKLFRVQPCFIVSIMGYDTSKNIQLAEEYLSNTKEL